MGIMDRILGRDEPERTAEGQSVSNVPSGVARRPGTPHEGKVSDEQAVERYRYMLQTAPPETIEQAHEEAFSKLTPEQRRMLLDQLKSVTPREEQAGVGNSDDPKSLARMATRAEVRQPGVLEKSFGSMGGGMSMGGLMAGGLCLSP